MWPTVARGVYDYIAPQVIDQAMQAARARYNNWRRTPGLPSDSVPRSGSAPQWMPRYPKPFAPSQYKGKRKLPGSAKGKRPFNKRRKPNLYRMQKKLNLISTPAPVLNLDWLKLQISVPQGAQIYTGFGGNATQILATPYNFTSSPEDVALMLASPFNNNGSSGPLGQERTIVKEWRTEYFFTNIDNSPVEIECIALKCKNDLPYVRDWKIAKTAATGAGALTIPTAQLTFEAWLAHAAKAGLSFIGGTTLLDLSTLNPNQTATPNNAMYPNLPGARLTDIPLFNDHFKIASTKTRVLQPGEAYKFIKYRKQPRIYKEATMIDYTDYTAESSVGFGQLVAAKKGTVIYVWRLSSVPVSSAGGGTASVTLGSGHLNLVQTIRWRSSFCSNDQYGYVVPGTLLPTNTTEKLIFPGTSTATAAAPAT